MAFSIPEDTIRRIKNVVNIVDVIGEHVVLKKAGRNFQGLCPFHAEKTPSFSVSPEKQIFYCFGCHTGGNVFSFLMQHESMTFPEAVRVLGGKYGIDVPQQRMTPAQREQLSEKEKLYKINDHALTFFRRTLNNPDQGQKATSYLLGRGMTRKIIDGHALGFAPNSWDGLLRYFQNLKVSEQVLVKAGLIIPRKDRSGFYDRFRDRVMFPIFNLSQQVIGFGGRVMGDELPKYLNSPETEVFNKSQSLYGIDKAKASARTTNKIYLVEGYFDVLAMHLYGIENTVATLGTSLTAEHVRLLKGLVGQNGRIVLVYDSDQAGIKAAHRSIHVFEEGFADARILVLPQDYDPDLFLREKGPDIFYALAENAMGMVPFVIDSAVKEHGLSIEGKVKAITALQEPLAAIQDSVARTLYIQQLAERLDIDESAIMEKVRQVAGKSGHPYKPDRPKHAGLEKLTEAKRLEQQIIAMMLRYPVMIPEIINRNIIVCFEDEQLKNIAGTIVRQNDEQGDNIVDAMISSLEDPQCRNLITELAMTESHWDRDGCERLLSQFQARHQRKAQEELRRQIQAAEKDNNFELLDRLLRQKQQQAGKKG